MDNKYQVDYFTKLLAEKHKQISSETYQLNLCSKGDSVGTYYEKLVGVRTNNLKLPDWNEHELKMQNNPNIHIYSQNPYPHGSLIRLSNYAGVYNEKGVLYYNANLKLNEAKPYKDSNKYVLFQFNEKTKNFEIRTLDKNMNDISEEDLFIPLEEVLKGWIRKARILCVGDYDCLSNGKISFNKTLYVYKNPIVDNFLYLVKKGIITYNISTYIRDNGKKKDHGGKFDIPKSKLNLLYAKKEKLIGGNVHVEYDRHVKNHTSFLTVNDFDETITTIDEDNLLKQYCGYIPTVAETKRNIYYDIRGRYCNKKAYDDTPIYPLFELKDVTPRKKSQPKKDMGGYLKIDKNKEEIYNTEALF